MENKNADPIGKQQSLNESQNNKAMLRSMQNYRAVVQKALSDTNSGQSK